MSASEKVHVLAHPVVNARLSKLRQTSTNGKEFREVLVARAGRVRVEKEADGKRSEIPGAYLS